MSCLHRIFCCKLRSFRQSLRTVKMLRRKPHFQILLNDPSGSGSMHAPCLAISFCSLWCHGIGSFKDAPPVTERLQPAVWQKLTSSESDKHLKILKDEAVSCQFFRRSHSSIDELQGHVHIFEAASFTAVARKDMAGHGDMASNAERVGVLQSRGRSWSKLRMNCSTLWPQG